jgi:hypothetical protein
MIGPLRLAADRGLCSPDTTPQLAQHNTATQHRQWRTTALEACAPRAGGTMQAGVKEPVPLGLNLLDGFKNLLPRDSVFPRK